MMYFVGIMLPLALTIVGACLIAMGVTIEHRGDLAIAGAILLGAVLISASSGQRPPSR